MTPEKPAVVSDEHLKYLDDLRVSGIINMFGAAEYVVERFQVTKTVAKEILRYWMESFEQRHSA